MYPLGRPGGLFLPVFNTRPTGASPLCRFIRGISISRFALPMTIHGAVFTHRREQLTARVPDCIVMSDAVTS
jgi:hypothetical protein